MITIFTRQLGLCVFLFVGILFCSVFSSSASASTSTVATESNIVKLIAPITISKIKARFGKGNQGHGPYLWYLSDQSNEEMWFWYLPKKYSTMGRFEIAFITKAKQDDPDNQTLIWPATYKDMPLKDVIDKVYGELAR